MRGTDKWSSTGTALDGGAFTVFIAGPTNCGGPPGLLVIVADAYLTALQVSLD